MAFENSEWVWMNGSITAWKDATIHVSAHALHYGSGVFEGIRCYETEEGPAVFRLDAHLERFYASAGVYGLDIPYTIEELSDAVCETIRRNGFKSCYIRPICYFGSDTLGVNPRKCPVEVTIMAWPWSAYLGADGLEKGVRITVSPWTKFHSSMLPTTAKACGQYINSMLAVRDALDRGFDEALLLNIDGTVAEGSGENLFLVSEDHVITNDEKSSILLGITRHSVIKLAEDLGYEVEVREVTLDDVMAADEVFFTGTAAEVTPIREVDGATIGEGRRGPVTKSIQEAFFAVTSGRDERYRDWLHLVEQPAEVL